MSIGSAFQQNGKTVSINAGVSPLSTPIALSDMGLSQWPQSLRVVNNGTTDIWVWFTATAQTAAFPVPGTTTPGTPAPGFRAKPGIVEVFGLNVVAPNVQNPLSSNFFVNTIALAGAQVLDISPGEGL